jgi:hypothetical protein
MISTYSVRGTRKTSGQRARRIVAGAFALATMLAPLGASAMNNTPRLALDRARNLLPMPPIPCLESMRWMSWKPEAPIFKTDILLWPDYVQPGHLQLPSEHERSLPRVS